MSWLYDLNFWEECLQWFVIGFIFFRFQRKPFTPADLGSVKVTEEHLKQH